MIRSQYPVLETPRLRLEPLGPSHSAGMFDLWREPAVCEHSGPAVDASGAAIELPAATRAESDRLLEYWTAGGRAGSGVRWAVLGREGGDFVGAIGYNVLGSNAEYAYHLIPRYWGRGLAAEASLTALAWAFSSGAESIECHIESANSRSIQPVRRLGFHDSHQSQADPRCYVLSRDAHAT